MRSFGARALATLGFSFLIAIMAACGGAQQEARAPGDEAADAPRVGSAFPDPSIEGDPSDDPAPGAPAASSGADDGSDIIPPFPSSKGGAKKATPAKKKAGKSKKKKG
ncbi:MAG: hypothetical protein KF894_09400 [Labilithrix sp.]|nr:hypothetical protein [Labilithrix sp.]